MDETEGDYNRCERALSSTDDMASVDGNLDVAGRGADDRIVGGGRWVYRTTALVSKCVTSRQTIAKDLPRPRRDSRNARRDACRHTLSLGAGRVARPDSGRRRSDIRCESLRLVAGDLHGALRDGGVGS